MHTKTDFVIHLNIILIPSKCVKMEKHKRNARRHRAFSFIHFGEKLHKITAKGKKNDDDDDDEVSTCS